MKQKKKTAGSMELLDKIVVFSTVNPFSIEKVRMENELLGYSSCDEPLHFYNVKDRFILDDLTVAIEHHTAPFFHKPHACLDWTFDELYQLKVAVWCLLYHKHLPTFQTITNMKHPLTPKNQQYIEQQYEQFYQSTLHYFELIQHPTQTQSPMQMTNEQISDLFAFCYKVWRGYSFIIEKIIGRSQAMVQLRMDIWDAIFTRRIFWSFEYLKERMANFSTLILGATGTGKELIAHIIAHSQFIPFDAKTFRFAAHPSQCFQAVNISALTPTLIESELFGHKKGSFTGAVQDRKGLLEQCTPYSILFLDEIGDLNTEIQVKLLRVLQNREYTSIGDHQIKRFHGRIVSATNIDINQLVHKQLMRPDFLYRIGSITIRTPSLKDRLIGKHSDLDDLLKTIIQHVIGTMDNSLYQEIKTSVEEIVQSGHPWHGNVRELEQCVRGLLVSSSFTPVLQSEEPDQQKQSNQFFEQCKKDRIPLEQLVQMYCHYIVKNTSSYQEAAGILDTDWRTVKAHAAKQ